VSEANDLEDIRIRHRRMVLITRGTEENGEQNLV
jgi:hypothetical protein